jgi:hypothetical protein
MRFVGATTVVDARDRGHTFGSLSLGFRRSENKQNPRFCKPHAVVLHMHILDGQENRQIHAHGEDSAMDDNDDDAGDL